MSQGLTRAMRFPGSVLIFSAEERRMDGFLLDGWDELMDAA